MPIVTRPSNAQAHPGQIVIEGQRVRQSKKQIEANDARKKAASIEDSRRAEEEHQRIVQQLKESEDAVEREEELVRKHTVRPDLWYEFLQLSRFAGLTRADPFSPPARHGSSYPMTSLSSLSSY
jgi:hypothetical protein